MVEIPEDLLKRSAEARAKALGVPVEDVLAEMKGEGPPVEVAAVEQMPRSSQERVEQAYESATGSSPDEEEASEKPVDEVPPAGPPPETPEITADTTQDVAPAPPTEATPPEEDAAAMVSEPAQAPVRTETPSPDGSGNGKVASVVSPRPSVPPTGVPEGVRTQRLLTVVKARAIQTVKAEPTDKVNTWPHLMLMEFAALLAITGFLVVLSVIIHSPLLDPANFNQTPNPSKAPWYFLGLQELLSYFDPQIAGVMVPLFIGMIGFMMIPYVDKNPSTRPSDRKFAILLYSIFLAGSATLTMFGVLFRGQGFNWSYPWVDGVFFDDLKDWVNFE